MTKPRVVSREQWLIARNELLAEEKRFSKLRDELTRKRQAMPWVALEQDYRFVAPAGEIGLAELFELLVMALSRRLDVALFEV